MTGTVSAHRPVLLEEALEGLAPRPDGLFVDCTFGRGGHAQALLDRLGNGGRLFALDRDPDAIASAEAEQLRGDPRFTLEYGRFSKLKEFAVRLNWAGRVSGVLMDLGVSSPQLDVAERGFSFQRSGPLDMRMDTRHGTTAAEWLAGVSETELARVLRDFGEERYARRIAQAIISARTQSPVLTTTDLAKIIERAVPTREKGKHPATRSFQAIRIFVNRELDEVEQGLRQAVDILGPGGRLVVISFHSLEDRIVKRFMRDEERGGIAVHRAPGPRLAPRLGRIGKAVQPSRAELSENPRARSAVLRVAERVAAP